MDHPPPDSSISKYLKLVPKLKAYRVEDGYRNPSTAYSLKTRPQTQISAFSQTFSKEFVPVEINKNVSKFVSYPNDLSLRQEKSFKIRNFEYKKEIRPKTQCVIDITMNSSEKKKKTVTSQKRNQKQYLTLKTNNTRFEMKSLDSQQKSNNSPKSNHSIYENQNFSSHRSIKINSFNSIELPHDSLTGALLTSLFRQNQSKSTRKSIIQQTLSEIRKFSVISNGIMSPRMKSSNYKNPMIAENISKDKELEAHLNMKNYKLSKSILNSLKKICETAILERPKTSDPSYIEQKILEIYTTLLNHLSNIPSIIEYSIKHRDNKDELFSGISNMTNELTHTRNYSLLVEGYKLQAKIYKIYGDFSKSLQVYIQAMQLCNKYELFKLKTKIYKRLGKLYLELQNIPKAKSNFIKTLQMAWYVSSKKYELIAYDLLGLIAYYEGAIDKAKFYHNRMLKCELEDKNSSLRIVAMTKIKTKIELRKSMENNYMIADNAVSSDEDEVGLYEVIKKKENIDFYNIIGGKSLKNKQKIVSLGEKQKMLIAQTGSSMFKNKTNIKEEFFSDNVLKKIRRRLQKEREMYNLIETSRKTNINDVFKQVPIEISNVFRLKHIANLPEKLDTKNNSTTQENNKISAELSKGIYGVQKSVILKDSQKIESFKFMKTTSINKNNSFLSHLSSNRNLDRFSRIFDTNQYNNKKQNNEIKLYLDKRTSQKIKKSLLKFRSNILVAVSRLEVIKRGKYLSPNNSLYLRRGGLSVN